MTAQLTLDKAGRVVLPKPMRDELQVGPGDTLEIESSDGQIVLRPVRGSMPLRKKHGIWVFRTGAPLSASSVTATLREVREDRDRQNTGKAR
jgi:AbrB family looped-hinge helix DNA binding protein